MSTVEFALLVLAGFGAGLTSSIAGLASLISYPALLATGLPPITANVTNTVALVLNSVGSVSASRPELAGQRARLLPLVAAGAAGGGLGAALLLGTPADQFEELVPLLIAAASAAMLLPRPHREPAPPGHAGRRWRLLLATLTVAVYGGYFGAAAGVLLLALFLLTTDDPLPRANALKNVVLGCANAVAAVGYAVTTTIAWSAALPLAIGLFAGGRLGPAVVRRAPGTLLRRVIALAGLGLAVRLGWTAYR